MALPSVARRPRPDAPPPDAPPPDAPPPDAPAPLWSCSPSILAEFSVVDCWRGISPGKKRPSAVSTTIEATSSKSCCVGPSPRLASGDAASGAYGQSGYRVPAVTINMVLLEGNLTAQWLTIDPICCTAQIAGTRMALKQHAESRRLRLQQAKFASVPKSVNGGGDWLILVSVRSDRRYGRDGGW